MISSLTRNCKYKTGKLILGLLLGTLLLGGCEGPSTTVLQNAARETLPESAPVSSTVTESGSERLYEAVNTLYMGRKESFGRVLYDDEVTDAIVDPSVYILSVLRGCSYDVTQTGEVIEAVLRAETDDPDICLVIACYGGYEDGTGASDIAAGAAVLLETAETLNGVRGDTEIRFVFLPGGRDETGPIYTYLEELYLPDDDRLLGAVLVGGLGLNDASENVLGCAGGTATFMAEQINRVCRTDLGRECILNDFSVGVMNALLRNRIPTVVFAQKEALQAGTVLDCPSLIDYAYLKGSADILSHTLALLIGDGTPSMRARAHYTDSEVLKEKETFSWGQDQALPFGETEQTLESMTGILGEQISENTYNGEDELTVYRFPMKWFGTDEIIPTDFYFLSDALSGISIRAFEAGIDFEKISEDIAACYGVADSDAENPYGPSREWVASMQRIKITLDTGKNGYDLVITESDTPPKPFPSDSLGSDRLRDLFDKVIPETAGDNLDFEVYTDGYGGTVSTLIRQGSGTDQKNWKMGLDLLDALSKNAAFKDKPRTVLELARLYGEYLAREDPSAYYNTYHSMFGGDEEDFARDSVLFTLSDSSIMEAGMAAEPVRYFLDFEELMDFRDRVQNNLD